MSLCVASCQPLTVSCFLNGHSYVAQELRRAGVRFQMDGNAIVRCADPDQSTAVAERLDERILQPAPPRARRRRFRRHGPYREKPAHDTQPLRMLAFGGRRDPLDGDLCNRGVVATGHTALYVQMDILYSAVLGDR